jgi:hypothetical protein
MGFSEESINRNPAADLEGGTFFRVSGSSVSRVAARFFRPPGGRSTLMAGSSELCKSAYILSSGRTVAASDVWPVIIAAPLVQTHSGPWSQWDERRKTFVPTSQRLGRLVTPKTLLFLWRWRVLGTAIPRQTAHGVAAHSKRRGPVFAG